MAQPLSEEKKQQWKDKILEQHKSGLTIASWCRQNNVAVTAFYYWQKKLFPKPDLDRSSFSELAEKNRGADKDQIGITLELQGILIHVGKHFDPLTLKQCLEIIGGIKC